jgi:spore germination protein YaaH
MSQHRFPSLLATTLAGLVILVMTAANAGAAAPAAARTPAVLSHPAPAAYAPSQPIPLSGRPHITDYMDQQLRQAPIPKLAPFTPAVPLNTAAAAAKPHREVFGYVNAANLASGWVGYPTWDFNNLSTVSLFGLHENLDGSFASDTGWAVWDSSYLTNLMNIAHPRGIKVVPSIIFHDYSSTNGGTKTTDMCAVLGDAAVSHTISDVSSQVQVHGADGININYEGNNQLCPNGQYQAQMLVSLVKQLRYLMPNAYISISTYNGSYYTGYFFDLPALNQYVDSFFVMDYDSTWSNYSDPPTSCSTYCFSPNAPLISYTYNDTNSMEGYLGVVPASKVIMGVPYYGNTACIPGPNRPGPNATPFTDGRANWSVPRYIDSSTTDGTPGVSYYGTGNDTYSPTDTYSTWWDGDYACWRESYWDNLDALAAKYDLVNHYNLRGVGIFTLDYGGGSPGLWQLLHQKFGGCTGASVTASPAQALRPGAVIHLTSTATACSSPNYEYWIQYPGGGWFLARSFGGANFDWDTHGFPLGAYTIHVWANQAGDSTSSYQVVAETKFTLAVVPPCASATVSPSTANQLVTTAVSFTAGSSGCTVPQYEYWVRYPNGSWSMKRTFSGDPTWTWNTSGLAPGTYLVHAWANQYGDQTAALETTGESQVTLTGCTSPVLTPSNPSVAAGSIVNFSESVSGCTSPQFEYWLQSPTGLLTMVRSFSADPTWSWNTAGLTPGAYTVRAWANQQGDDTSAPDVTGSSTITLGGCAAATLSPATTIVQGGSKVAFTATSSGCPNPQYEYWVQWLDGTWHIIRPFSADPTFTWNAGGFYALGTYTVHVWANQQGADTSLLEAMASSSVTLAPPCSAAYLSPSSGSIGAGGAVTFTASAASCPNPLYEFWLQDTTGGWHMMQAFATGNTWRWDTTGLAKGTYHIHVWANEPGSDLGAFQVLGYATYTVT